METTRNAQIEEAKEAFGRLLEVQLARAARLKAEAAAPAQTARPLVIGLCPGDGIGPALTAAARRVLETLLAGELAAGAVELRTIEGLTIERRMAEGAAVPEETMREILACDVLLKGPTTTPDAKAAGVNLESANVALRKALDLYANVRPVRIPAEGVDWTFFRENTEGSYAAGKDGLRLDTLGVDFTFVTEGGCERIIRRAFEYAKRNGKPRVTAVTKANIIKTTDGMFLKTFYRIAAEYPGIAADDWYIDIMTAKLLDPARRRGFSVLVLPNLYGDIITDEAAELQGGVGTAGSANIGSRYAMFEAIHGSAPRMVEEGRAAYADPASLLRAAVMLLEHIGFAEKAAALAAAMDTVAAEKVAVITGRPNGATAEEYADALLARL